jgi:hypothetical protein
MTSVVPKRQEKTTGLQPPYNANKIMRASAPEGYFKETRLRRIFATPYRLNCLRIANKNSANNDDVSSVSKIATTRPQG